MRALIFVALFATAFAKGVSKPRAFEDIIIDTVECVRQEMIVGFPDWGIPHFNPLQIEDHTFVFSDLVADAIGELNVQDLVFGGLVDFTMFDLSGNIGLIPPSYTVKLTLNFPQPTLSTKYVNKLVWGDIDTWGTGTLDFVANNFAAAVDLKATILGGISLEYFNIWVSMDALSEFVITGVRDDEEYSKEVSDRILANGVQIIEDAAPTINQVASEVIMGMINDGGAGAEDGFLGYLIDKCLGA